jgi:hypothetical protein
MGSTTTFLPNFEPLDLASLVGDGARDFVPRDRGFREVLVAVLEDPHVGPADRAGVYLEEDVPVAERGDPDILYPEVSRFVKNGCLQRIHPFLFSRSS